MEQTNTNTSKKVDADKLKGDKVVDIPVAQDLEKSLIDVNEGLPKLPGNIIELLVKIAPWLSLLGGIFGAIGVVAALAFSPLVMGGSALGGMMGDFRAPQWGVMYLVNIAFTAVFVVLNFMAFGPLKQRNKKGWDLMFYGSLLSIIENAISLNILGIIIGSALSFYILFQVRPHYKY